MSDYPATLGDLTDVEVRLDARLSRLERRQATDTEVTDEKVAELRARTVVAEETAKIAMDHLSVVTGRLAELERLWDVALENPELIRELAVQGLKGRWTG